MSSMGGCFTQPHAQKRSTVLGGGDDDVVVDGRVHHANQAQKLAVLGGGDDDVVDGRVLHANQAQKCSAVLGGGDDDVVDGWLLHANHAQKRSSVLGGGDNDVVDGRVLHANQAQKIRLSASAARKKSSIGGCWKQPRPREALPRSATANEDQNARRCCWRAETKPRLGRDIEHL